MDRNVIEKVNAALKRLKRRRSIENNPDTIRSSKRLNTPSTSSAPRKTKLAKPLVDITNNHEQVSTPNPVGHSQSTPTTQPSSTLKDKQNRLQHVFQPMPHGINLFNKFTATTQQQPPTTSNAQNLPSNSVPTQQEESDSDSEYDSEIEIFLDEHSSSDSEPDVDSDYHDFRQTMSHTFTGNASLQGYDDLGDALCVCQQCGSNMWYDERKGKSKHTTMPKFQICCGDGKVELPFLKHAPPYLQHLLFGSTSPDSKHFQQFTRVYNAMFSFTSPGFQVDTDITNSKGPPTLRIQGQTCHRMGTMCPEPGESPKYAQLYIYDTENEIDNRMKSFRNNKKIDRDIVVKLCQMLDENNVHAKGFRMARDVLKDGNVNDLKLKLISERSTDGRIYNQPTVSEVAALIVGDVDSYEKRDIILHIRGGQLQRIDEFHPSYLSYQYPLIFPWGEDGFRDGILLKYQHETVVTKRNRLTIKAWLSYRIQTRDKEAHTLICSRRLFQQFLVDGFTMMEADRLNWLRKNQSKLRVGKYHRLNEDVSANVGDRQQKRGKRVVLPSTFVGSRSKYPTPEDINQIISAEIPNPHSQKELYHLVKKHMMHGPCGVPGKTTPCTRKGPCANFFPKKWKEETIVDSEGFPIYRRRRNRYTIVKEGITLDNRYVVPYNAKLLLKYQAHINMEWCNQRSSIKYLFKYIHKGYDRISATVVQNRGGQQVSDIDEIKQYLDCRYISPSEACWRIFGFSIHGRRPAVERMFFHLIGENSVYFTDNQQVEHVLEKPSVTESMFTSWLEANAKYAAARQLTYGEFVTQFVYVKKKRCWTPRKKGYTIGRLIWVPPCTGELYYLRMMLTVLKGPISYEDIKKVAGIQLKTFREACFAMGFLGDDKEFIGAIKEASHWGTGRVLRFLFVTLLLSATMDRPAYVWKHTLKWLSDGILYAQRRIANNPELQLSDEQITNLTLLEIEKILEMNRRSLKEFKCMPYPKDYVTADLGNRLIYDEHNYNVRQQKEEFDTLFQSLTGKPLKSHV
ncbi:hypothetical protein QL285_083707 [Trifolium repens]|nr:hypothetical protein QL285_083707 [Trifolium repens]